MGPVAVTIGNFDGAHRGHAALVSRARALAGPAGRVVVLAFEPHPMSRLRPAEAPARLTTFDQRAAVLRGLGADVVDRLDPTPELLAMSPDAFVSAKIERYAMTPGQSWFVEGADFHFGKGRAGSVATLAALAAGRGVGCEVVPPVEVDLSDQQVVRASSTIVRWLLSQGRVRDAARVLGRPYEMAGTVVRGDRRGRTIGVPTANLVSEVMPPGDGVYAGRAFLPSGEAFAAAINVGMRPTVAGLDRRVEVHLLTDRAGEWATLPGVGEYDWALRVQFLGWVRDELRFGSLEALREQISRDLGRVRELAAMDPAGALM